MKIINAMLIGFLTNTLIVVSLSYSQPKWVKDVINKKAQTTIHQDASAIMLYHAENIFISEKEQAKSKIQYCYHILSNKGKEFGILSVPISPFRKVKSAKGWRIIGDGIYEPLSKKNLITTSHTENAGYYSDDQLLLASFSEILPGEYVAYEVDIEENGLTSLYQSFVFQVQQPVKFAQFSITIPKVWKLNIAERNAECIKFERNENVYTWTASDLPFLPDEPLAPPWSYLSQRLSVNCFNPNKIGTTHFEDWKSVCNWCADVFCAPAEINDLLVIQTQNIINGLSNFEDKLQAIASFCQHDIRHVAVEIEKGRWEPRPAATTLYNRYGDCKDKTTLMRALLNAAGIHSAPAFTNSNYPVDPRLPTPFQFDHCIIAIPVEKNVLPERYNNAIVDNWLFFDPTNRSTSIGQLPWLLQGNRILVGAQNDSILYQTTYPNPKDLRRAFHADLRLDDDGSFSGQVIVADFGALAVQSRYAYNTRSQKEQIEDWFKKFSDVVPIENLFDYKTKNFQDSVQTIFSIKGKNLIQQTGDFFLLKADIFHENEPNPLTQKERAHPIWLGAPMEVEINISWHLPDQWSAEADTTCVNFACRAASIYSKVTISKNIIHCYTREQQNGELMSPQEYRQAQDYCKQLSFVRGQTILLRNKK